MPLLLCLGQEVDDPLAGLGILLEQLILLLPHSGGLLLIPLCPLRQFIKRLLGVLCIPAGLGLPPSKIVRLRGKGCQLGHPLSKLGSHVLVQPCLIDEAVPTLLVFT